MGKVSGYTLEGLWQANIGDGRLYDMSLPGTLDENKIGGKDTGSNQWHPDAELGNAEEGFQEDAPIATRFTRKYTFEGEAKFTRKISFAVPEGKRVFLEAERARCLRLLMDGQEVPDFVPSSISTPHVFEITRLLNEAEVQEHELTLLSDNSYPGLPHDAIVYSSAATDETQTNWNGVLGYIRLRVEDAVFIEAVRVYPVKDKVTVKVDVCGDKPWKGNITISSKALQEDLVKEVTLQEEATQTERVEVIFEDLPLREDAFRWDEYEGNLYELTATLVEEGDEVEKSKDNCAKDGSSITVTFGIRDFGDNGEGRLALNDRTIFVRSETSCAEFPEMGHCPMTVAEWMDILQLYKEYGVNLVRFHSHCPPEAAFIAADELGMLMQPELSHWNPKDAFETEESYQYYKRELLQIIRILANHPSFVMLTLGNELHASAKGHERMQELLKAARELDATRMYADGSNVHYGAIGCDAGSDFYASQKYFEDDIRGTFANMEGYINNCYPNARTNYDKTMEHLRETYKKPVFSFEVGQFEVLPDFDELKDFQGISDPVNLRLIQQRVEEKGLTEIWKKYVEATGELSRIGYREEIEAAMRTKELSGISLLGLQDFPGQGTALVGMLNSHLQPKPFDFAKPEGFKAFFTDQLPLVLLPKYTYENTETLKAEIQIANFGKKEISGCLEYQLQGEDVCISGVIAEKVLCPVGQLLDMQKRKEGMQVSMESQENGILEEAVLEIPLYNIAKPSRLDLTVSIGKIKNNYPIWVYPPVNPVCPEGVYETGYFDEAAREALAAGKTVYLTPPSTKEALPNSIKAQFTTDFWSVGTFAGQEGGMGQLIDDKHPIFKDFPTEFHTNWQWWIMATQRAVILPKQYECIITEMDSYAYLRPMAQLLECKCGNGKLLFSSMGLQDLQKYPEARALLASIYRYLTSEEFAPKQEIEMEVIAAMLR